MDSHIYYAIYGPVGLSLGRIKRSYHLATQKNYTHSVRTEALRTRYRIKFALHSSDTRHVHINFLWRFFFFFVCAPKICIFFFFLFRILLFVVAQSPDVWFECKMRLADFSWFRKRSPTKSQRIPIYNRVGGMGGGGDMKRYKFNANTLFISYMTKKKNEMLSAVLCVFLSHVCS